MKTLNVINPKIDIENSNAHDALVQCWAAGFQYDQTSDILADYGFDLKLDEYKSFFAMQDVFMNNHLNTIKPGKPAPYKYPDFGE